MALVVYDDCEAICRSTHCTVFKGSFNHGKVAVKRARTDEGERRAQLEVQQLRGLRHENIVKFLGVYSNSRGKSDIVLEYAEGKTLAEALENLHAPTLEWKRSTVHQIATGLAYLHAEGIQHRDLKPKNILFKDRAQERLIIADFGMATSEMETSEAGAKVFHRPDYPFSKASDVYCLAQITCCIIEEKNATGRERLRRIRERAMGGSVLKENRKWLKIIQEALFEETYRRPSADEFRAVFTTPADFGGLVAGLTLLGIGFGIVALGSYFSKEESKEESKKETKNRR